jgi:hypothetical protein
VLDPCTIRLATLRGSQCILRSQGFSLNSAIHGIHGSFQKSIASPLLTTKQAPFRITHFNFSIAFHRGEAYLRGSLPNQSSYTLYLLLRASRHKLFFLEAIIQVSLASKAWLNTLSCLNPRPLATFGRQSTSQNFHARYEPFSFFGFHQNR